jgi:hypothetical protein
MREKIFSERAIRRLAIALVLAAFLVPISASPVAAINLNPYSYFDANYSITLSDNKGQGEEVFYLLAEGRATCIKDLPMGVDEVEVAARVIAQHKATGVEVVLNPAYSVVISPFPDREGETCELKRQVKLIFPGGSQTGEYEVIGQLIQVKVDGWDITELIPEAYGSHLVGSISYVTSSNDGSSNGTETPPAEEDQPPSGDGGSNGTGAPPAGEQPSSWLSQHWWIVVIAIVYFLLFVLW